MKRLRAVVLDWAGTTVDYGCLAPVAAMQQALRKHGVAVSADSVRRHMGLPKRDHLVAVLAETTGREAAQREVDAIYAAFLEEQRECVLGYSAVMDGVAEAVDQMRARGLKIGSTTGYPRAILDPVVERAAHEGYRPDAVVTPDDVRAGRPKPWMCFRNLELLDAFPPGLCMKIGDTVADVEEARAAGMWAVAVVTGGNEIGLSREEYEALPGAEQAHRFALAYERLAAAGAHLVISGLEEWAEAVARIERALEKGQGPGVLEG